jgi:DNA-directed RNA polymerase subunit F
MIIDLKPLSLAESSELIEELTDEEDKKEIRSFIKKFNKTDPKDAKSLREDLEKLESIKIKAENIVKIIDLMPEDESDVIKIFTEANLNKEEIESILELVKKYK